MSQKRASPLPRPLPTWLAVLGSLLIAFHQFAILMLVLGAPSGPWPTQMGESPGVGPKFAADVGEVLTRVYLEPLRMTHNYHFPSNRFGQPAVAVEAHLKDEKGQTFKTLRFPSPDDNAWARNRHQVLADGLGNDEPVLTPRGEVIPAPGQRMERRKYWTPAGPDQPNRLVLRETELHLIPRDPPPLRPRAWSLLLVRSYERHLAREHGAAAVEVVRLHRQAVMPDYLFLPEPPPGLFDTVASSFQEERREK